jgi:hypothetical protein
MLSVPGFESLFMKMMQSQKSDRKFVYENDAKSEIGQEILQVGVI